MKSSQAVLSKQMPLNLSLHLPARSFASYVTGENSIAYSALQEVLRGQAEANSIYLWGEKGTGKTHLLQAACLEMSERGKTPVYLPMSEAATNRLSPEVLEGLERLDLVCLDDLQYIAGSAEWEQALFSLYNQLREAAVPLLICADAAPNSLDFGLGDLLSRLNWGGVFSLTHLDEKGILQVLQNHAKHLGMQLPHPVATYLIRHLPHNLKDLVDWLDRLDYVSLAAKRRITIPFVREVLNGDLDVG